LVFIEPIIILVKVKKQRLITYFFTHKDNNNYSISKKIHVNIPEFRDIIHTIED